MPEFCLCKPPVCDCCATTLLFDNEFLKKILHGLNGIDFKMLESAFFEVFKQIKTNASDEDIFSGVSLAQ